jgi:hypothetical protein
MSVAFLFCIERGQLEQQALLLCRSIRRWGGRFAESPIHGYRPRVGEELSPATLEELDALGVTVHEDPLNMALADVPTANKVFAGAAAEAELDADALVFCDSDTVFLNEPSAFDLAADTEAALRPVGQVGFGTRGPGDDNEEYWARLYELTGVTDPPWVTTVTGRERIRGYWNAGLVAVRRDAGILGAWRDTCLELVRAGHIPDARTNLDQVALAAVLSLRPGRVATLDDRYNYPLPRRAWLTNSMAGLDLDELVHIHYHRWFNRPSFLSLLQPPLDERTPQYRWLEGFLPFEPTIEEPLHGQEPEGMDSPQGRRKLKAEHGTRQWNRGNGKLDDTVAKLER